MKSSPGHKNLMDETQTVTKICLNYYKIENRKNRYHMKVNDGRRKQRMPERHEVLLIFLYKATSDEDCPTISTCIVVIVIWYEKEELCVVRDINGKNNKRSNNI